MKKIKAAVLVAALLLNTQAIGQAIDQAIGQGQGDKLPLFPDYSCADYLKDSAQDQAVALNKAFETLQGTLYSLADNTAFKAYQEWEKQKVSNALSATLLVHRDLIKEMDEVFGFMRVEMEIAGPDVYLEKLCNLRPDATINDMATSSYRAYKDAKDKFSAAE